MVAGGEALDRVGELRREGGAIGGRREAELGVDRECRQRLAGMICAAGELAHAPVVELAERRRDLVGLVDDAEARFTPEGLWPPHPMDLEAQDPADQPFAPLYFGACGVVWALHYLQDLGAVTLRRNYLPQLDAIQQRNRAWLGADAAGSAGSYLMGDTPFALMACAAAFTSAGPL